MYQIHGLTGSTRIIFEDLCRLLAGGEQVSINRLSDESGYSRTTVIRAVSDLRRLNLISVEQEKNGTRAEYTILEEDGMFRVGDVVRAFINIFTMTTDERTKRMLSAIASKGCYDDAHKLQRLAGKIGGHFERDVEQFLEANGALKVMTVWELDEAYQVREQIQKRIEQARERLGQ